MIDTGTFCNKVIKVDMYLVNIGIQIVRIYLVYIRIKERRHSLVYTGIKKWASGLFTLE